MKKRKLTLIALVLVLALLLAACGGGGGGALQQQPAAPAGGDSDFDENWPIINWRGASTWGEGNIHLEVDRHFAQVLSDLTGGRFNITVFPGGQLGADHQVLDMVAEGTVEVGFDWPGYWSGRDSGFDLLATTMHNFSAMDYIIWIYEAGGLELYHHMYNQFGVHYFPLVVHSMESGFRGTVPIEGLGDLEGMSIRLAGRIQGMVAERIGFNPVMISALELYEAMSRGVVDAGEFSVPAADFSLSLHEAASYWWAPGWHQSAGVNGTLINMDAWNSLPANYQMLFEMAARITVLDMMAAYHWEDFRVTRIMLEDYGVTVNFYPESDLDRITIYVREAMAEMAADNPNYRLVYESMMRYRWWADPYRDIMGRYGFGFSFPEFGFENRWTQPEPGR